MQKEVTTAQPSPFSGQPAEPLRPPAPVVTAGRFMRGGAVTSAAYLVAALPFIGDVHGKLLAYRLTAAPLTIALVILAGLVVIALWLWMARANGQGRNWARIVSTVLVGLGTLELISAAPHNADGYLAHFTVGGHTYSMVHSVFGATVLGLIVPVLLWLTGLTVVWLLWRPASTAFFKPQGAPAA